MPPTPTFKTALITGATGFLGNALAQRLHQAGVYVTATGRNPQRGAALSADGLRFIPADLSNSPGLVDLCRGQAVVFHCAAHTAPWAAPQIYWRSNVLATARLVQACQQANVKRLVYVSSPSVMMRDADCFNLRESDPLPSPISHYAATKGQAEQLIHRAAQQGLPSIILRPRGIFGPGDTVLFPRLLRVLQTNHLPIFGTGHNLAEFSYIDNVVDALILAAQTPHRPAEAPIYTITNAQPVPLWELIATLALELGHRPPRRRVSRRVALTLAAASESLYRRFNLPGEPRLTRYAVIGLTRSFTFNITAARTELGYQPRIDMATGLTRFRRWWQAQR